MGNISVVVNYEKHSIFPTGQADGYIQFTRSGDRVYITVNGQQSVIVEYAEFTRVQKLFSDDRTAFRAERERYGQDEGK